MIRIGSANPPARWMPRKSASRIRPPNSAPPSRSRYPTGQISREPRRSPPLFGGERVLGNAGCAVQEVARCGELGAQRVQVDVEQLPLPLEDLAGDDHGLD